jgi:hypothetical protein
VIERKIGQVFSYLGIQEYRVIGEIDKKVAIDMVLCSAPIHEYFNPNNWRNLEGIVINIKKGRVRAIYKIEEKYLYIVLYG